MKYTNVTIGFVAVQMAKSIDEINKHEQENTENSFSETLYSEVSKIRKQQINTTFNKDLFKFNKNALEAKIKPPKAENEITKKPSIILNRNLSLTIFDSSSSSSEDSTPKGRRIANQLIVNKEVGTAAKECTERLHVSTSLPYKLALHQLIFAFNELVMNKSLI